MVRRDEGGHLYDEKSVVIYSVYRVWQGWSSIGYSEGGYLLDSTARRGVNYRMHRVGVGGGGYL